MRFLLFLTFAVFISAACGSNTKKIVCYLGSWSAYRQGVGKFNIEDIDAKLCTHLIYSFVGLTKNDVTIKDPNLDLDKNGFSRFNGLRKRNPGLKTMVAIGGWNEGSAGFSRMAASPSSRGEFVDNVINFIKKYDFDGLDMDWEYPAQREGASPADVDNFVALLRDLRIAFDRENLLLSAAVAAAESSASKSYNIKEIAKYLHFVNLMAYDLHGHWDSKTGMHSALYAASSESGNAAKKNIDAIVNYWLSQGTPREKLILGTPLYGRSFTIAPGSDAVGSISSGPGKPGVYTGEAGLLGFNEICESIKKDGWQEEFDEERRVPYAHKGSQWVSYENVKSIREKAEYVNGMGLGGAMVWSIETDDFKGRCGDKYPLLKTLNEVLRNGEPPSTAVIEPEPESIEPESTQPESSQASPLSPPSPDFCEPSEVGLIPDPTNCNQFFNCVPLPTGLVAKYQFTCPSNLCFKQESGVCDWP